MRAVTLRRIIVFGVCALGVGSLYLVPSVARSPEQIGVPKANDDPTIQPVGAQPDTSPQSASPSRDRNSLTGGRRDPLSTAPTTQLSEPPTESPDGDKSRSSRKSPDEPKDTKDSEPPEPVADIEPSAVTADRLSLRWPVATDDVGVIGYRIWLNGFEVATTAETEAKLRWFNDDSGQHVVQIRALDAAGNQSRTSPTLVVVRPSPEPTPTPTPSESPTPTDEPTESGRPAAQASDSRDPTPTGRRSESQRQQR
jgi:hypothetical protein